MSKKCLERKFIYKVRFLRTAFELKQKISEIITCVKPSLILLCLKVLANCSSSSRSLGSSAWAVTVGTELMGGAEFTALSMLFSLCNDHSLLSRWCYSTDWGNTLLSQTRKTDSASISNTPLKFHIILISTPIFHNFLGLKGNKSSLWYTIGLYHTSTL